MMKFKLLLVSLLLFGQMSAQKLAFDGAYGAGAYTVGGRGGDVYHVTNLNDSGPGSFREAVKKGKRTVVFDVSGIIKLNSILVISEDYITIAGQTAPAGGITLTGDRVYVSDANHLIVRYIRFRGGINAALGPNDSVSAVDSIKNQIWDHCSFSFGGDESASWYGTGDNDVIDKVTIQNCIFAESPTGALFGGLSSKTTVGNLSFHHNLFYNIKHRFPNVAGNNANIEVINNVTWYVANRLVRGNGSFKLRHEANIYNFGSTPVKDTRLHMYAADGYTPTIYTKKNVIIAPNTDANLSNTVATMNSDNTRTWKWFLNNSTYGVSAGQQLPSSYFTNSRPRPLGKPVKVDKTSKLLPKLLLNVGASRVLDAVGKSTASRDALDKQWIQNISKNVFKSRLSTSSYNVPNISRKKRPANYDTDKDGMPNRWEELYNLNPKKPDNNGYNLDRNYTNLEMYLNGITNIVDKPTPNIRKRRYRYRRTRN